MSDNGSDDEYTPSMDEVRNSAAFGAVLASMLPDEAKNIDFPMPGVRVDAKTEFDRAIAAHDADKDRQIAALKARLLAVRIIAYEEFNSETFATIYVRLHAALTEKSDVG